MDFLKLMSLLSGASGFLQDAVLNVVVPAAAELDLGSFLTATSKGDETEDLPLSQDVLQRKYFYIGSHIFGPTKHKCRILLIPGLQMK